MPEISVCDSDNLVLVTRSEARRVSSGIGILLPTASVDFYLPLRCFVSDYDYDSDFVKTSLEKTK